MSPDLCGGIVTAGMCVFLQGVSLGLEARVRSRCVERRTPLSEERAKLRGAVANARKPRARTVVISARNTQQLASLAIWWAGSPDLEGSARGSLSVALYLGFSMPNCFSR